LLWCKRPSVSTEHADIVGAPNSNRINRVPHNRVLCPARIDIVLFAFMNCVCNRLQCISVDTICANDTTVTDNDVVNDTTHQRRRVDTGTRRDWRQDIGVGHGG
jgi:hypothetical protein